MTGLPIYDGLVAEFRAADEAEMRHELARAQLQRVLDTAWSVFATPLWRVIVFGVAVVAVLAVAALILGAAL